MSSIFFILWVLGAYLFASISWAYALVKLRHGVDLRTVGSGNLGATNASRLLGAKGGVLIYFLDMIKGCAPALCGRHLLGDPTLLDGALPLSLAMGGAAILGHCFPFYLNFKGGKGVATGSGVIFALAPLAGLCGVGVFALLFLAFRIVSLGSICAAISLPVSFALLNERETPGSRSTLVFLSLVAILVVALHHSNIRRLLRGEEARIGRRRS